MVLNDEITGTNKQKDVSSIIFNVGHDVSVIEDDTG